MSPSVRRGYETPTRWSRIRGAGTNFVATESFKWCFNHLILAQSRHFGINVSPRMAVPTRVHLGTQGYISTHLQRRD
jgi:hypothetical protein